MAFLALAGTLSLPVLARNLGPVGYGRFSLFVTLLGVLAGLDVARPLFVRALATGMRPGRALTSVGACNGWYLALAGGIFGFFCFQPAVALGLATALFLHARASIGYAALASAGRAGTAAVARNLSWGFAFLVVSALSFRTDAAWALVLPFAAANLALVLAYRRLDREGRTPRVPLLPRRGWWSRRSELGDLTSFGLCTLVVGSADKQILAQSADQTELGFYNGQYDLAIKLNILSTALGNLLFPSLARSIERDGEARATERFLRLTTRLALAYAAGTALLIFFHEPIQRLMLGAEFAAGPPLYPFLLLGVFLHLFGFLLTAWQRARGEFGVQRRAYTWASLAMLAVGLVAIPTLGATGALLTYLTARTSDVYLIVSEARRLSSALSRRRLCALAALFAGLCALAVARVSWGGAL